MRHSLSCAAFMTLSLAAADPQGVHRTRIGDLQVTALLDGTVNLESHLLKGMTPAEARPLLGGKDSAVTPVNAFLVEAGGKRILVDTGAGPDPKGVVGQLMSHLAAAHIDPASIDVVLITHFHFDHIGGLVKADGGRAFPRAMVRVAQAEHDQWLGDPGRLAEPLKAFLPKVKEALAPYQAAGVYKPFAPGETPAPGVTVVPASGHTKGHSVYSFTSKGQTLWCVGDLIHFGAIQFAHPAVAVVFDANSDQAIASRTDLFKRAAAGKVTIAGAHLGFAGMGTLQAEGSRFTFIPTGR